MAAATAIIGAGVGLAQGGMSFMQASKQRKAADKAKAESDRLMTQARADAQQNFYEGLNVPMEAFGQQYQQNMQNQQQGIAALQEGDARTLAAGVGKVGMEASNNANSIRMDLQKDLYANSQMKVGAKENVKQQLIGMNVGKARDESMREKDQLQGMAQSMQDGFAGVGDFVGEAGKASALYKLKGANPPAAGTPEYESLMAIINGPVVSGK